MNTIPKIVYPLCYKVMKVSFVATALSSAWLLFAYIGWIVNWNEADAIGHSLSATIISFVFFFFSAWPNYPK